jgi:SAM-dependent methyltransferase
MRQAPVGVVSFVCNICGVQNSAEVASFHRELAPCSCCNSNPRFRGIIAALSDGLFKRAYNLPHFPNDKLLRGIGFSDWPGYAVPLSEKFDYVCTWYEREPRLDLTDCASVNRYQPADFVICTEVFEHIPKRMLRTAFRNLRRLLKSDGLLVFSVPYTDGWLTIEHFGNARDIRVLNSANGKIVQCTYRFGRVRSYQNPMFHGGGDTALEMRMFSRFAAQWHLRRAGFSKINTYREAIADIGYYWPPLLDRPGSTRRHLGYVMTARA